MAWVDYTEDFEIDTGDWYSDSPNAYIWQATGDFEVYEGDKSCRAANSENMFLVYDLDSTQEGDVEFYYWQEVPVPEEIYITVEYYDGTWHTLWSSTNWVFDWTFVSEHFNSATKVRIGWYMESDYYSFSSNYYMIDLLTIDTLSYYPYPMDGSETSIEVDTEGAGERSVHASGSSEATVEITVHANGSRYSHPSGNSRAWNFISAEGSGNVFNPVPVLYAEQGYNTINLSWNVGGGGD